jgi:hypothetical protein
MHQGSLQCIPQVARAGGGEGGTPPPCRNENQSKTLASPPQKKTSGDPGKEGGLDRNPGPMIALLSFPAKKYFVHTSGGGEVKAPMSMPIGHQGPVHCHSPWVEAGQAMRSFRGHRGSVREKHVIETAIQRKVQPNGSRRLGSAAGSGQTFCTNAP